MFPQPLNCNLDFKTEMIVYTLVAVGLTNRVDLPSPKIQLFRVAGFSFHFRILNTSSIQGKTCAIKNSKKHKEKTSRNNTDIGNTWLPQSRAFIKTATCCWSWLVGSWGTYDVRCLTFDVWYIMCWCWLMGLWIMYCAGSYKNGI